MDFHYPVPPTEDCQSIFTATTLTAGVHADDSQSISRTSTLTAGVYADDSRSVSKASASGSRSVSRASTMSSYTISPGPTDFTPQLSQAPDFRVPTRETPQGLSYKRSLQQSALWERDEKVSNCHDCNCRFGLLTRKVSLSLRIYLNRSINLSSM